MQACHADEGRCRRDDENAAPAGRLARRDSHPGQHSEKARAAMLQPQQNGRTAEQQCEQHPPRCYRQAERSEQAAHADHARGQGERDPKPLAIQPRCWLGTKGAEQQEPEQHQRQWPRPLDGGVLLGPRPPEGGERRRRRLNSHGSNLRRGYPHVAGAAVGFRCARLHPEAGVIHLRLQGRHRRTISPCAEDPGQLVPAR